MCGYNPHVAARVNRTRTKTCPRCGVVFVPKDWRNTFCGYRCAALDREERRRGGPMPTKTCERCGVEFEKNPDWSQGHWEKRRYCSMSCRGGRERRAPDRICATCGKTFYNRDHPYRPYCSQACYFVSLRTERYPVTRESRRLHNFSHRQRRHVLKRAGHRCERCGSSESLEVDHILPVWNGGTNALENGQALCVPCHDAKTYADVEAYWSIALANSSV